VILEALRAMEFNYAVKIPKERIAVLVGKGGAVKKKLEKSLHIKVNVDSDEGDVFLRGDDGIALMTAQNIVRAVGRGFNPDFAFALLEEGNYFEMLDIDDFSRKNKKSRIRMKARVIGSDGKARKTIEEITNTHVVVYGKTIAIIGTYENIGLARKAFESLLRGSRHSTVYAWLEKERKKRKSLGFY